MSAVNSALILTLKLDDQSFNYLDSLRKKYFPLKRNFIPAHLTIFHKLLGENIVTIKDDLKDICSDTDKIILELPRPIFLGNGVAIEALSKDFKSFRDILYSKWLSDLCNQDKHNNRPHITIQNKVSAAIARKLYEELTTSWQSMRVESTGVLLWLYCNGPWQFIEEFNFRL